MSSKNNKTFFRRAESGELGYKDIFSDVFKRHTEEDTARVFIAGTSLTTPNRAGMLAEWIKPFLFARFFAVGALAAAILGGFFYMTQHELALYMLLILIPCLIPMTMFLMAWEMNIPRNISLYEALKMILFGGVLSLFCTALLVERIDLPAYLAPVIEEPAKLLLVCLFLGRRKQKRSYILNGILVGFAVGTGFALMESIQYSLNAFIVDENFGILIQGDYELAALYGIKVALIRLMNGVVGHGLYAALYGGAIAMVKQDENLKLSHLFQLPVLIYFAAAFLLHALNNSETPLSEIWILRVPALGSLLSAQILFVLYPLGFFFLLPLLRRGVNQIVEISVRENGGLTNAVNAAAPGIMNRNPAQSDVGDSASAEAWYLQGLSGELAGRRIALSEGSVLRAGRDASRASLVLGNSPKVSGLHCEFRLQAGRLSVRDLGSTNGTLVDARRIPAQVETEVHEGSTVCLGDQTCSVRLVREMRG